MQSQDYFTELKAIKQEEGISDLFLSHIHELINRNYTQAFIATTLQVSNTTVSKWVRKEFSAQTIETTLPEPRPKPYQLSTFEEHNLRDLATKPSPVSRNTPVNSPSRQAAESLEAQLQHYIGLNKSISQLAKAANVSRR